VKKLYGLVSLLFCALTAGAQDPQMTNVTGRLLGGDPIVRGYLVELEGLGPHSATSPQADVRGDGEFSIRNVPYGEYLLKIVTYRGESVAEQFVSVQEHGSRQIDVRIPEAPPMPTGGTVSFKQLQHPPARKAVQAAATAERLAESGRTEQAAGELEKAVRISPDYAAAHTNLGVQYLRLRRYEEARVEIQQALEIAGPNALDLGNLAFAYAGLQRLDDAITAARRALQVDRHCAAAHYLLGSFLVLTPATRSEGIAHLEEAADAMPAARRELEKWKQYLPE
jgi:tetratricopeptide (TPR) repeat protein